MPEEQPGDTTSEAYSTLLDCSIYFRRTVPIEEHVLEAAIPDYLQVCGYLQDANILKQSTEVRYLHRHERASNFFDYFEAFTFLLFEQTIPPFLAKEIALEFTLNLINFWDEIENPDTYENLTKGPCVITGIEFELQSPDGAIGKCMTENLAILCNMAINRLNL